MMDTISLYEEVADITKNMLAAAQQQDWERLAALEGNCAEYVERLKTFENETPLTGDAHARKLASIKSILADDREIRNLVAPWMVKLNTMLNNNQSDRSFNRYGA